MYVISGTAILVFGLVMAILGLQAFAGALRKPEIILLDVAALLIFGGFYSIDVFVGNESPIMLVSAFAVYYVFVAAVLNKVAYLVRR